MTQNPRAGTRRASAAAHPGSASLQSLDRRRVACSTAIPASVAGRRLPSSNAYGTGSFTPRRVAWLWARYAIPLFGTLRQRHLPLLHAAHWGSVPIASCEAPLSVAPFWSGPPALSAVIASAGSTIARVSLRRNSGSAIPCSSSYLSRPQARVPAGQNLMSLTAARIQCPLTVARWCPSFGAGPTDEVTAQARQDRAVL